MTTTITKTRACGPSSLNLAQLVVLAAWRQDDAERRIGEAWNPATRPRPSTALLEVEIGLRKVRQNIGLPLDRNVQDQLQTDVWICYANMLTGHGTAEGYGIIAKNLNTAMILTELGYGEEWAPRIREAMDGLYRAEVRHRRKGRWGFSGADAAAIREAIEVHAVQLEHASKFDLAKATAIMYQRYEAGVVYEDADAQG